jgi:hypothetical protein
LQWFSAADSDPSAGASIKRDVPPYHLHNTFKVINLTEKTEGGRRTGPDTVSTKIAFSPIKRWNLGSVKR